MGSVNVKCFSTPIFFASTIIHYAFGLVIDSVTPHYFGGSKSTLCDFFFGEFGLVKEVQPFALNGKFNNI
jgi:hypothetical protein